MSVDTKTASLQTAESLTLSFSNRIGDIGSNLTDENTLNTYKSRYYVEFETGFTISNPVFGRNAFFL